MKPLDSFVSASTSCLQFSQKGSAALLGMVATLAMVTASRTQSARESENEGPVRCRLVKEIVEPSRNTSFAARPQCAKPVCRSLSSADSAPKNDR